MHYQESSDEELMLAYQKGDSNAFEVLIGRHQRGVYNFLYRFLGQSESTEEAFQEVFERVIRSAQNYVPTARFSTWVYTIARNYCIDLSRKGKFRQVLSLDDRREDQDELTLADRISDSKAGPDLEASASNLASKLSQALDSINPDQREVFLMRENLGLPFEQISEIVNVSVNTVKSRMRYALSALQTEFKKLGITDPK